MAEIHVQTKKHQSNPAWIWIVLALIVAAAVIYFLTRNNTEDDNRNNTVPNTTSYVQLPEIKSPAA